jgi:hypothetical protein
MKLEERSALDWRFTDRNPHDNRADRAAAESSRRTACKGQGQDRPCRARPADRSLVAEDRSAGGVRDPTGPEELPRVLRALAHETVVTEDGPHPPVEAEPTAPRCARVILAGRPQACHSQRSLPVHSGQPRTTTKQPRPAPFPAIAGDSSGRTGFASRGSWVRVPSSPPLWSLRRPATARTYGGGFGLAHVRVGPLGAPVGW